MTNTMLGLKSHTDSAWTKVALSDEIALLRDHAHLERKAAGHMITLMGQVEGAAEALLANAREELDHFARVCELLAARGAEPGKDPGNPYVQAVAQATGKTLLDRVLRMGIIEARSYEHFTLLGDAAPEGDLKRMFLDLKDSEAGHHAFFIKLAYEHWPRDTVRDHWDALATAEAHIVANLEWGPRVH
jgi:tRNA-(ms[2]io[6]A)-hydroxylase